MNDAPVFSIILPVYNVEEHLARCYASLQKQSYTNFEIIFVDDCGQDNSIKIVQDFLKEDSRINIIKNSKNLGTFHARMEGVNNANGRYVVFLDPDDRLESRALEILSHKTQLSPDIIFFGSRRVPSPKFWQAEPSVPAFSGYEDRDEIISKIISCKNLRKGTEGKVFKREFLTKVYSYLNATKLEKLIYGEDKLLFFGAVANVSNAISVEEKLYIYYRNNTSITVVDTVESLEYKIEQLNIIISNIQKFELNKKTLFSLKDNVISDLLVDVFILKARLSDSFIESLNYCFNIAFKRRKLSGWIKAIIFLISFGKVKL